MCPRNRAPSCPLQRVGEGEGGTARRGWGWVITVELQSCHFFLSPAQPSTYPLPALQFLNFRPSFSGSLSFCVSIPSRHSVPISVNLSTCLCHPRLRSFWVSLPLCVSVPSFPVSPLRLPNPSFSGSPPCASRTRGFFSHLYLHPPAIPTRLSRPAGLLKEKERKAALPAATTPGPGLETAGPADAPAGAVVGGGSPRGRPGPVSAPGLLAPLLWERTLPFGDVEYVDLDAFLLEHGLPPSPPPPGGPSPEPSPARTPAPSPGPGSCGSASPRSSPGHAPARAALGAASGHRAGLTSRDTPSPVDPDTVEVLMTFEPDPADLALSSIPGHETFDPRRHRFSEEELKPQPIMKKARKIQVPEEQKDEKYWSRRYKNNEAAKRSRDARRLKENQISVRAAFLEKENALLRQEVVAVRQELSHYRAVLSRYQAQHGAL
ncbi:PREDICTED: D site-binding protein isoform X2 [Cercocebus atys]|uniref:D site-binding protein isoform X2 n=1 Tax=Cercocebus atys TaxID=9531 RepID=UPI0005F4B7A2|nr:PREDICTED: D site-binding protein isoform X2 [Cercocebus atys]